MPGIAREAGLRQRLQEIEELLSAGRMAESIKLLEKTSAARVPRELAPSLANLWRLNDSPMQAVQILARYVRPGGRAASDAGSKGATPRERGVYAAALLDLGCLKEAEKLLLEIPRARFPRSAFFL